MFIEKFYTTALAKAAYYIESDGEAALIDPLRDTEVYTDLARQRNAKINYIFETHFHNDFVSGHIDLQKITGAEIVFGPGTKASFPVTIAADGQIFPLGKLHVKAIHTPGHTIESTCWLLLDDKNEPLALFSGDTLLKGEIGRPMMSKGETDSEEMAGMLFDSLHNKLKSLPDDLVVYPASGKEDEIDAQEIQTTIGDEKQNNFAFKADDRLAFIKSVSESIPATPDYYFINAKINKEGYESLENLIQKSMNPLRPEEFEKKMRGDENIIVLDTRSEEEFTQGFVPESIFIGLNGRYAESAGEILPYDKPILLVTDKGKERESIVRLARVGFDQVAGYLEGGMRAWEKANFPIDMIIDIEADEFAMDIPFDDNLLVVDVRKETEFADGHVKDALNIPLDTLKDPGSMAILEESDNLYIHCSNGYRSVIAASLLKRQGFHNLRNVLGGWDAIGKEKRIAVEKESNALN